MSQSPDPGQKQPKVVKFWLAEPLDLTIQREQARGAITDFDT